MCVYIYMHIYIYIYTHTPFYRMYVCVYIYIYMYVYIYIYIYLFIYLFTHVYISVDNIDMLFAYYPVLTFRYADEGLVFVPNAPGPVCLEASPLALLSTVRALVPQFTSNLDIETIVSGLIQSAAHLEIRCTQTWISLGFSLLQLRAEQDVPGGWDLRRGNASDGSVLMMFFGC